MKMTSVFETVQLEKVMPHPRHDLLQTWIEVMLLVVYSQYSDKYKDPRPTSEN